MESDYHYQGGELELFSRATNWKSYCRDLIAHRLSGNILEVGAGIGTMTSLLCPLAKSWVCLEPDGALCKEIERRIQSGALPGFCRAEHGFLADIPESNRFDAILYLDVLEHIEDDVSELDQAVRLLAPGGRLVVLAPAHQRLYGDFDANVGHFRRYSIATLRSVVPAQLHCMSLQYLDCVGLLASAWARFGPTKGQPSSRQITLWDKLMVPFSRLLDPILGYRVGKSVLGVWENTVTISS